MTNLSELALVQLGNIASYLAVFVAGWKLLDCSPFEAAAIMTSLVKYDLIIV